jgi:hypothetical protein
MPKIQSSTKKNKITGSETDSLWITIPQDIVKLKGWKKGTVLEFRERSGDMMLVEVR